jgi:hypothetical protein
MGNRWGMGLMAFVAAGALVAGPLAGGAAWAKKSKIKCKVNGETFKTNARGGGAGGAYEPVTGELVVAGGRAKYHGRTPTTVEVDVRVLDFTILSTPDLSTATFPLTIPVTETLFTINHTKGLTSVENKAWLGDGVTMTVTRFDGSRIKGTAEGMIPPQVGTDTPAVLENCKFSVLLNGIPGQ